MSVYIRGIERPKNCGYCPIRHLGGDGDECFLGAKITEYQTRPENCPLIPVPDHGRLVDADELIRKLEPTEEERHNGAAFVLFLFLQLLKDAQTVIPSSFEKLEKSKDSQKIAADKEAAND